jgi:hypothetical protein
VLFSHNERHEVVMAARIDEIIDAPGKPGRKIIEGEPLPEGHAVYRAYVGRPIPASGRVRNPVTYFDSTVGGWSCGCGCGEEIYAGEFVRGHEQTALHQRVAQIGTIPEFLCWFDAVRAGTEPAARMRPPPRLARPASSTSRSAATAAFASSSPRRVSRPDRPGRRLRLPRGLRPVFVRTVTL